VTYPALQIPVPARPEADHGDPMRWEAYREGIVFLAVRALGDASAAEDIAQETLLRTLRAFSDSDRSPVRDPAAFVYGIARHLIIDAQRERKKTVSLYSAEPVPGEHPDALEILVTKETRGRINRILDGLSGPDRKLLDLAFVEGLKAPEIARLIGDSSDAVRQRKSRLIQKLREAFGAE
jgi:RNA polymerase sigma factor (sigma-70 family)